MTDNKLSRKELDALFREYRKTRSVALRNQIAEGFMDLVNKTAIRLHKRLAKHLDSDELTAMGMPGLIWAVEHYDPENCACFATYAGRRILGSIQDELRELDHVPRLTRTRLKKINHVTGNFYATHGRPPTQTELQAGLGLDDHQFGLFASQRDHGMSSLSEKVGFSDYRDETLAGHIVSRPDMEVGTLPDAEQIIRNITLPRYGLRVGILMRCRYVLGLSLREAGEAVGISESRASQIHGEVLEGLRGHFGTIKEAA